LQGRFVGQAFKPAINQQEDTMAQTQQAGKSAPQKIKDEFREGGTAVIDDHAARPTADKKSSEIGVEEKEAEERSKPC
jgi:hypothetical protein